MKFESSEGSSTADAPSSLSEATTTISNLTSSSSSSSSSSSRSSNLSQSFTKPKAEEVKVKSGRKSKGYVYRIREHVKFGGKLSETLKGKLSLGAEIIRRGGRENIFRDVFGVGEGEGEGEGERLLKASQCYLSTTAGPIAGILFVSTHKVAFWSERPLTITSTASPNFLFTTPYKVIIPVKNIKRATESENVEKSAQKYIQIVTEDNFEFWFMGFVRYEKAFLNLQTAISCYKSTIKKIN